MTKTQKEGVKHTAREFYQAGRITLGMAAWAMKNAGYTREDTIKVLDLDNNSVENEASP
jgi:hypothetical protein